MGGRKRIAYVTSLFPAVRETFIAREIIELERNGFEVTVVSLRPQAQHVGNAETPRADVWHLPYFWSTAMWAGAAAQFLSHPLRTMRAIVTIKLALLGRPVDALKFIAIIPKSLHLARLLRKLGIYHVHAHWATIPATCALFMHMVGGTRFSMSAHAWDIFARGTERLLAEKIAAADRVFVCTEFGKKRLAEFGGHDKVHVAYHGIDMSRYPFTANKPGGPLRVLAGGSLTPQKGLDVLLRALAIVPATTDWRLAIFGDGPERERLARLVRSGHLTDRVEFTGVIEHQQVIKRMGEASILVMPSLEAAHGFIDGLPNVIGEAMACGATVIGTRFSAIPELVEHEVNGLLVDPGNAEQLSAAVAELMGDAARRAELALNARAKVERMFDIHNNVKPLIAYFEGVV